MYVLEWNIKNRFQFGILEHISINKTNVKAMSQRMCLWVFKDAVHTGSFP